MCPRYKDVQTDIKQRLHKINDFLNLSDPKQIVYQENGWKELELLVKSYNFQVMEMDSIEHIVLLCIKLTGIYFSQINIRQSYIKRRKQIKDSDQTIELLDWILTTIFSSNREVDFTLLTDTFDIDNLWYYEQFCVKVTGSFITASNKNAEIFAKILDMIELYMVSTATQPKAAALLHIVGELCKTTKYWPQSDNDLFTKLLNLHVESVWTENPLRNGIEFCLKRILHNAPTEIIFLVVEYILDLIIEQNVAPSDVVNIGFSVQLASYMYKGDESLWTCFKYDTLKDVLTLISSPNAEKSTFGNQVFQNIVATPGNLEQIKSPKIFFLRINYSIKLRKLEFEDKDFIKRYRKELHLTFLTAVKNHNDDLKTLMSIYTSMALLIIEIPCEFTAAMLVCLVMNIQKNTLKDREITSLGSHRIHAIIIAIMSLICWITEATILYDYLDKILKLRAYNAPFLNPPLKSKYTYANHFILWNKPEFFFENFEVRYALWKRFRLNKISDKETGFKTRKSII